MIEEIYLPECNGTNEAESDYTDSYSEFHVVKPKWNPSGMFEYQHQTEKLIYDLLEKFDQPAHISALTEMCSNMLVMSAERNFETVKFRYGTKKSNFPKFTHEQKNAYKKHESICKDWRKAGRPSDPLHPAKLLKSQSQRNIQRLAREIEFRENLKLQNELMSAQYNDFSKVCQKLKQMLGDKQKLRDAL